MAFLTPTAHMDADGDIWYDDKRLLLYLGYLQIGYWGYLLPLQLQAVLPYVHDRGYTLLTKTDALWHP